MTSPKNNITQSTAGHTPGPWAITQVPTTGTFNRPLLNPIVTGRGGVLRIEQYNAEGLGQVEKQANARLIAAAPELLAALQKLAPILDNDGPLVAAYADIEPLVRAAIARATGGSVS